jgi:molecular chaperone GrpE (heat shock protein)
VQVLVDVGDQLDSAALAAWVTQALAEVGVAEVVVDGQRFDPGRHQAVDHVATTDPAADGLVARTSRRGFTDRDRVVRPPQVLVYRYQGAS